MADHSSLDYELADTLKLDRPEQYRALFDETRTSIIQLLGDRAATIKELAETLGKPKGTIGSSMPRPASTTSSGLPVSPRIVTV